MVELRVTDPGNFFLELEVDSHDEATTLTTIKFTEEDMMRACKEIKTSSSSGPDEFPALLLNKMSEPLAVPLTKLWKQSVEVGKVPTMFKIGTISPIHKGGNRKQAKNYRPVCLTSVLSRAFEKIVQKNTIHFLEKHLKINASQYGFRAGRSCLSQLLVCYDEILKRLNDGEMVNVVYTDFEKCFDKIDHGVLLRKMKKLGITGKLGEWIESFLVGRTVRTRVGQSFSNESIVKSGLPQGTVIGPLLLLIMNWDLDANVKHSLPFSFADDAKLIKGIKTQTDSDNFQSDLDSLYDWADTNNMKFNNDKFVLLRYGEK